MLTTLAFRHLVVRKRRSLFLLLGFSLGVGVMIVLLSIGEAMLDQSRDVSLVGGGEVTVLPLGIDIEAMRTGGLSGMFFGIDRARFLTRVVLGGPRHAAAIRAVAPGIENKLLYACRGGPGPAGSCSAVPVRAGGEIPSRARALGAGLVLRAGRWSDSPADSAYVAPTLQQLYDELDRFHFPRKPDSTWGEWHYFNLVAGTDEWWYITYLIGGEVPDGSWGGRLLLTGRRPDGRYQRFTATVPADRVKFDTAAADVELGGSFVRQRGGVYTLRGRAFGAAGEARFDLVLRPEPYRYFPPLQLGDEHTFESGYVVPALMAAAWGRICVADRCTRVERAPAYHDHNWGVWRDVTWEWGTARGSQYALLYGGIYGGEDAVSPFFLTLVDSLGVKQVLRFQRIQYQGSRPVQAESQVRGPERFSLFATRDADSVRLEVRVLEALATRMTATSFRRVFLQMRGDFTLSGRLLGAGVADSGSGFFETYVAGR